MEGVVEPGRVFGDYSIERLLGRGGMAEVYLARRGVAEAPVALKVVGAQFAADPGFRRRFERESRLARRLAHPHVVAVIDAGEREGRLYLVTEYVEGPDLAALLAVAGPLHAAWAAEIVAQLADALDAAAALSMVHRDVKPANVLLREREGVPWALLADFGLSKEASSTSGLTATGQWLGTVDYASPEQLQAVDVDPRTDVYSLGAVLHRCLTGQVPFPRDRDVAKVLAHITEPPPRPSEIIAGLPPGFDEIVARAMAKEPEDRYPSAAEMGAALRLAAGAAGEPPPWAPTVAPPRSHAQSESDAPTIGPDAPTAL